MRFLIFCALVVSLHLRAQTIHTGLTYSVQLPAGGVNNKTPVLVMLHGYGSHEADLFSLASQLNRNFIVFSVRGPVSTRSGGYCWFPLEFLAGQQFRYDYARAIKSREQILSFISKACKAYKADSANVFLFGFSQGAILSYDLLLSAPQKIRGIVALSGRMLPETAELKTSPEHLKDKPVFIAHGTGDNVIRYNDGMAAAELLKKKGLSRIHFINYNMAHTISQDEIRDINAWLLKQLKMISGK